MKVKIEENLSLSETEIIIVCPFCDDSIKKIAAQIKLIDKNIIVKKEGESYILPVQKVFYFDCANDKIFCYGENEVYETPYRLYELENIFADTPLVRVNKYQILNISKIKHFKSSINGRMEATLTNGEKIEISRYYVPQLKERLKGAK